MKTSLKRYFAQSISFNGLGYPDTYKILADIVAREKHYGLSYMGYMQGLPSWCSAVFSNYDIVNIMKDCGYKTINEDKLVTMYWYNLGEFVRLNEHKIKIER